MTAAAPARSSRSGPAQTPWSRPHFREGQTEGREAVHILQGPARSPQAHSTPDATAHPAGDPSAGWRHLTAGPPRLPSGLPPPRPDALPSGRQPCRGSARLPGPLGTWVPIFQQLGCSLTRLHPRTSWGPPRHWASACPSQTHLPTSASSTFSLTGPPLACTRLLWASRLRGQALSLPASGAPTPAQS